MSRLATVRIKHFLIRMEEPSSESGEISASAERTIRYCEELCAGLKDVCPSLLEKIDRVHPLLDEYATVSADLKSSPPGRGAEAELRCAWDWLQKMGHWNAAEELERAAARDLRAPPWRLVLPAPEPDPMRVGR